MLFDSAGIESPATDIYCINSWDQKKTSPGIAEHLTWNLIVWSSALYACIYHALYACNQFSSQAFCAVACLFNIR